MERVRNERQIVGFAMAQGAKGELPDLDEAKAKFDELLHAPPKELTDTDVHKDEWRKVMGVA
jgi:hypothetical protein